MTFFETVFFMLKEKDSVTSEDLWYTACGFPTAQIVRSLVWHEFIIVRAS